MHIFFLFLYGFVEICCSAFLFLSPSPSSRVTHTFLPWSLLSAPTIPLNQLQSCATEVITFCIGGSEEQEYAHPQAAYLSNAIEEIPVNPTETTQCIQAW